MNDSNEVQKYMRNITRCLPYFVLLLAPLTVASAPLSASAQMVYNESLGRVLHMPEDPVCKVLLAKVQKSLQVDVNGAHNIYDPYTGKKLDAAFVSSSYPLVPTIDGIKWGQEFPGVYQIVVIPDDDNGGVTVNGTTYGGVVAFYQVEDKLAVVNWISLDELTSSLLSSNFLPKDAYQKETIAAYAIALRSLVYNQMMNSDTPFWDVRADECGYQGKAVTRVDLPFIDAMRATKKIVMIGGGSSPALKTSSIEELRRKMPSDAAEALAKEGKDARLILHKYYPNAMLTIAEKRPTARSDYLR